MKVMWNGSALCLEVLGLGMLLGVGLPAHAQAVSAAPPAVLAKYAAEPVIVEQEDSVFHLNADGTGWRLATVVERVQSEAALREVSVLSIPYAADSTNVQIVYARVRHSNGTVVETPVTDSIDMPAPVTQQAPFYSDLKVKQLPVRSLQVGDTLEWQARVTLTKAEAPGETWGSFSFETVPVTLEQSLTIYAPSGLNLSVWSPGRKPELTTAAGERVYRWSDAQLKPTVGPAAAAKEAKKKTPLTAAEELDQTKGALPDVAWTTFKSWAAVGAWYRGLEDGRTTPDAAVNAKVAELTAGKVTEEEKARAVYSYVFEQIRYIGVAFGIGRYQPHQAAAVLGNQYGDCKDKHTLLAAMLEALGLHPAAVLIGAGVRFNEAVPSPGSFNHLITQVQLDGKTVWLDSTAEVAPFGMLSAQIRDQQALVVPQTGMATVERTPAGLPFASFQTMTADGSMDAEGLSNSHIVLTLRGDDELAARQVLRSIPPSQYDVLVQKLSEGMGYAGTTSHADISHIEDTSQPLVIAYDYKRDKGGDWADLKALPQLAPVDLFRPDAADPPIQAIQLGQPRTEDSKAELKLPAGWGVELPEALHQKSAYATLDETYRFDKGVLYTERRLQVLQAKVPQKDWKLYNDWVKAADLSNFHYVQLIKPGSTTTTVPLTPPGRSDLEASDADGQSKKTGAAASNTEAEQLIYTASREARRYDLASAQVDLDKRRR